MLRSLQRGALVAAAVEVGAVGAIGFGTPAHAAETGTVFLIQGVAGSTMTLTVDGRPVAKNAAAKSIVGPLKLSPGKHTVVADAPGTDQDVSTSIQVPEGGSIDAVIHRPVDATARPVMTTYTNNLSAVPSGNARLTLAHTAAVGPADIRVKGKVLFANVANGEELTLTVPAATYPVEIVPATADGPAVLGPVDLPVKAGTLTRVFAIGVAANSTMDAVVHVQTLPGQSTPSPTTVDAGSGGQAASLTQNPGSIVPLTAAVGAALGLLVLLTRHARRAPVRR